MSQHPGGTAFQPVRCSVCSHPSHLEINRSLVAGATYRSLAAQFGLSPSALCRHARHLARQRQIQLRREDLEHQNVVIDKLDLLDHRLDRLFNSALDLRAFYVALGCIRESLRLLSFLECVRQDPVGPP
jgi:hypothetical protein